MKEIFSGKILEALLPYRDEILQRLDASIESDLQEITGEESEVIIRRLQGSLFVKLELRKIFEENA